MVPVHPEMGCKTRCGHGVRWRAAYTAMARGDMEFDGELRVHMAGSRGYSAACSKTVTSATVAQLFVLMLYAVWHMLYAIYTLWTILHHYAMCHHSVQHSTRQHVWQMQSTLCHSAALLQSPRHGVMALVGLASIFTLRGMGMLLLSIQWEAPRIWNVPEMDSVLVASSVRLCGLAISSSLAGLASSGSPSSWALQRRLPAPTYTTRHG